MKKLTRTNIKMLPSQAAINKILRFCNVHNLPYTDFIKDPHCTIIYSKEQIIPVHKIPCPNFKRIYVAHPFLDIFHTQDDGDVLVIRFDSDKLQELNAFYRKKFSFSAKYPYIPHLTLQKNLPEIIALPKLDFTFVLNKLSLDNHP